MTAPTVTTIITGRVYVDLAPYVTGSGGMRDDGYKYMWHVIAGAPLAVPIRFNLGRLRYFDQGKIQQYLEELPHKRFTEIDIQGEESRAIQMLRNELTDMLEDGCPKRTAA